MANDGAQLGTFDHAHDLAIGHNSGSMQFSFLAPAHEVPCPICLVFVCSRFVILLISYRGSDPCHVNTISLLALLFHFV
jgi:hypothetical protein